LSRRRSWACTVPAATLRVKFIVHRLVRLRALRIGASSTPFSPLDPPPSSGPRTRQRRGRRVARGHAPSNPRTPSTTSIAGSSRRTTPRHRVACHPSWMPTRSTMADTTSGRPGGPSSATFLAAGGPLDGAPLLHVVADSGALANITDDERATGRRSLPALAKFMDAPRARSSSSIRGAPTVPQPSATSYTFQLKGTTMADSNNRLLHCLDPWRLPSTALAHLGRHQVRPTSMGTPHSRSGLLRRRPPMGSRMATGCVNGRSRHRRQVLSFSFDGANVLASSLDV